MCGEYGGHTCELLEVSFISLKTYAPVSMMIKGNPKPLLAMRFVYHFMMPIVPSDDNTTHLDAVQFDL